LARWPAPSSTSSSSSSNLTHPPINHRRSYRCAPPCTPTLPPPMASMASICAVFAGTPSSRSQHQLTENSCLSLACLMLIACLVVSLVSHAACAPCSSRRRRKQQQQQQRQAPATTGCGGGVGRLRLRLRPRAAAASARRRRRRRRRMTTRRPRGVWTCSRIATTCVRVELHACMLRCCCLLQ
jgi:hypothetical protein